MKRTDLQPGTEYAFLQGKYGIPSKVRVINTEAVHRPTSGYGYSGSTENKDGLRVAFVGKTETYGGWFNGHLFVTGEKYASALADPTAYSSKRTIDLYDGTDRDEQIIRVLPRYIIQTWAEHEAEKAADAVAMTERIEARKVRKEEGEATFEKLPERYKEFIEFRQHPDGSGGWTVSKYKAEGLANLLIEENA